MISNLFIFSFDLSTPSDLDSLDIGFGAVSSETGISDLGSRGTDSFSVKILQSEAYRGKLLINPES